MRTKIVDAVVKDAPSFLAAQARALVPKNGNIAELLLAAGFSPRDVLEGCAAATGLPPAPAAWLRDPRPPNVDDLDVSLCRRLQAAPLASVAGRLCIGFSDPEIAAASDKLGLPVHTAYLALPADLKKALAVLPVADDEPATRLQPSRATEPGPSEGPTLAIPGSPALSMLAAQAPPGVQPGTGPSDPPTFSAVRFGFTPGKHEDSADEELNAMTISADLSALARAALPEAEADDLPELDAAEVDAADDPGDFDAPKTVAVSMSMSMALAASTAPGARDLDATTGPGTRGATSHSNDPDSDDAATISMPGISKSDLMQRALEAMNEASPAGAAGQLAGGHRAAARLAAEMASPTASTQVSRQPGDIASGPLASPAKTRPDAGAQAWAQNPFDIPTAPRPYRTSGPVTASSPGEDGGLLSVTKPEVRGPNAPTDASVDVGLDDGSQVSILIPEPDADADAAPIPMDTGPRTVADAASASDEGAFASLRSLERQAQSAPERERLQRIAQLQAIRRYRVERVLGRGGMATVYAAMDTKTGRPCALKVMEPHLADDAVFVERFRREVRASRALEHDNIIRTFDSGEEQRTYYMVSELVEGGTVQALAKAVPAGLPTAMVVPLMQGLLAGLQHAHDAGIVHRDLKPANLMLSANGVLKIGDFGIGKHVADSTITKTGALFGTPAYMSPEQAQGFELDARSDLYGAGIVIYELLAGANPFSSDSPGATMMNIARGHHPDIRDAVPAVPALLGAIIERLLTRDRAARYASARDALAELAPLLPLIERRLDGGLARAVKEPAAFAIELARGESQLHAAHGARALEKTPPEAAEAAFRYHCASHVDPKNTDAYEVLQDLTTEHSFRLARLDDDEARALAAEFKEEPGVETARRLLELAGRERAILDVARWARAVLLFSPDDAKARQRLDRVIGADPLAPFSVPAAAPRAAPATGGAAFAATVPGRAAAPPSPPRAVADSGAAFDAVAAAAADDAAAGFEDDGAELAPALSPSGGTVRPTGRRRIRERVRKREEPPPPPPPPVAPRLRDLASLDPSMPAPPEVSGKTARPKSEGALAPRTGDVDVSAARQKRPAGGAGGGLVAAGVAIAAVIAIAGWQVLESQKPVVVVVPPSNRPPPMKIVTQPPPPPPQKPSIIIEKPRSGDPAIGGMQAQLLKQGTEEADGLKAVKLLTQAIDIDPHAPAAKDALMARAKRYEAAGELQRASFDFKSVIRQNPTPESKRAAEEALVRIEQLQKQP